MEKGFLALRITKKKIYGSFNAIDEYRPIWRRIPLLALKDQGQQTRRGLTEARSRTQALVREPGVDGQDAIHTSQIEGFSIAYEYIDLRLYLSPFHKTTRIRTTPFISLGSRSMRDASILKQHRH